MSAPFAAAAALLEALAPLGAAAGTSVTAIDDDPVAFAAAVRRPEGALLVAAVADPAVFEDDDVDADGPIAAPWVTVLTDDAHSDAAHALARTLALRSPARVAARGLCSVEFPDLDACPWAHRPPQVALVDDPLLPGAARAIGAMWADVAGDPAGRVPLLAGRGGPLGDALTVRHLAAAADGLARSLRKGKDPLLTAAALTFSALFGDEIAPLDGAARALLRGRVAELLRADFSAERAELLGAVVDAHNDSEVRRAAAGRRVALFPLPLAGREDAVGYFYDGAHQAAVTLDAALPERPLAPGVTEAGFTTLGARFKRHRGIVERALGLQGGFELRRGFHGDASADAVAAAFQKDGFVVVPLLLDAG